MNELKSDYADYAKIEKNFSWPEKPGQYVLDGCIADARILIAELRDKVRERSLNENLAPILYEKRLYRLRDFISDLRSALNYYSPHTPDTEKNEYLVPFLKS